MRPVVAGVLVALAYVLARMPSAASPPVAEFQFVRTRLGSAAAARASRSVHPDYVPIAGWISSVGAAASLGDLENSGRPDGCILVDPRTNEVSYLRLSADGATGQFRVRLITRLVAPPLPARAEATWAPMGSVIGDFDGDGWLDVLVYYWGRLPVIFRNPHGGGEWRGEALDPAHTGGQERWFTNCVCQADIDGDGRPDLVIGNYFPSTADVLNPAGAKRTQEMQSSMSNAANGGRKYILLNHSEPGHFRFIAAPIVLDDDEGASDPATRTRDILDSWTLAIGAGDLDGDCRPELYFANDFGPDRLLYNESTPNHVRFRVVRGARRFDTPKSKTLGRDSFKGMGVDFAVMAPTHLDEAPTILVSNIAEPWALLESHFAFTPTVRGNLEMRRALKKGVAPFRDRSEPLGLSRSGWGWDIKAADFRNDGQLEIVQALGFLRGDINKWAYLQELATGNDYNLRHLWAWPYFRTAEPGEPAGSADAVPGRSTKLSGDSHLAFFARSAPGDRFVDIGAQLGFEPRTVSRGIALGDIDHDGREDFILANQWQDSFAVRNVAPRAGNYLGVRVLSPAGLNPAKPGVYPARDFYEAGHTGSPVIGARIIVQSAAGRTLAAGFVDGGNGHSGHRAAEVHFGLGAVSPTEPLYVHIQWRPAEAEIVPASDFEPWRQEGWASPAAPLHAALPGTPNGWWVVVVGDD